MLRLIASDLDGTLLQNGAQSLTASALEKIGLLSRQGIIFVAASGRQYPNLVRLFGPLSEQMAFICENGAYVVYRGEELSVSPMDRELGIEIMKDIRQTEDCEILLSGRNTSYLQPKTWEYENRVKNIVKNNVTVVDDITKVEEPFLKVSVYRRQGVDAVEEHFCTAFGGKAKATVSGVNWLDFTDKTVNKGMALTKIQRRLGILPEETIVFGDNYNDIEMFRCAGKSFVMSSACPEVKNCADEETVCVEDVLEELLAGGLGLAGTVNERKALL